MLELTGQVALITGGGTGLGREIALLLAHEGMQIGISYARSREEAEQTAAEIEALGGRSKVFQADLSKTSEAEKLVQETAQSFGRLDLLIHNAATTRFIPFQNLEAVDEVAWDDIFAVNTRSAFFLARAAAPILRQSGGGQIITTSSIAGIGTGGSSLPYAVSKAALIHLTKCLAVALAPDVRVNCVAPGLLLTRWVAGFSEAHLEAATAKALLKKATDLDDVAAAFVMLAKNTSITGQVIVVDAGLLAA
jgi:3-oxoacyl-[acyl-carrier protein] reductase